MYCPRCGRAVNETSNFCGGCGLSRAEIEKYIVKTAPQPQQPETVAWENRPAEEPVKPKIEFVEIPVAEPVIEPVIQPVAEPVAEPVIQPVAEPVIEPVVAPADAEIIAEAVKQTEETKAEAAQETAQYSYVPQPEPQPQQESAEPKYSYTEPAAETVAQAPKAEPVNAEAVNPKPAKNKDLSTVDFIWMMVISAIPVIGFIYLIYLALQNDNTNKRSYARASLILSIFAVVISIVFGVGFMLSGL